MKKDKKKNIEFKVILSKEELFDLISILESQFRIWLSQFKHHQVFTEIWYAIVDLSNNWELNLKVNNQIIDIDYLDKINFQFKKLVYGINEEWRYFSYTEEPILYEILGKIDMEATNRYYPNNYSVRKLEPLWITDYKPVEVVFLNNNQEAELTIYNQEQLDIIISSISDYINVNKWNLLYNNLLEKVKRYYKYGNEIEHHHLEKLVELNNIFKELSDLRININEEKIFKLLNKFK